MTETSKRTGNCLCGAIRITANNASKKAGACHCGRCRRWSGGPMMGIDCGTDVSFEGEDNISVYDSSAWAERGFCKKCGSHLFYRFKANQQCIVPIGLFENQEDLVFDGQIFVDKKPSFYSFANKTHDMTEAEFMAAMAAMQGPS